MRNIGITGFTSVEELQAVQALFFHLFQQHLAAILHQNVEPRLMAGILVSSRTMKGQSDRFRMRYPKPAELEKLFTAATKYGTLNLCHYVTSDPDNLVQECEQVMQVAGSALHGFQFNICWPKPAVILELRARHPEMHLLLQVGKRALNEFALKIGGAFERYDADAFMTRVQEYQGCFDAVLLDPSSGQGILLDTVRLDPLVRRLMKIEGLGVGVAGGLSAGTITHLAGIGKTCPYLSIDAEGRLRSTVDDTLDMELVEAYLRSAFELFYQDPKITSHI